METERDFQRWVVDAARLFRYRIAHFRPAPSKKGWRTPMEGDPGWPDLVLCRAPRLIFAELKVKPETQKAGRPREDQEAWLTELAAIPGAEVYVWRPSDRQLILDILR